MAIADSSRTARSRGPRHAAPRSTAHGSATVAMWTLVSRGTGLLRVIAIGAVLGPTFTANTFVAANNVPNVTYTAVAGPVLGLVVVPVLVRLLLEGGMPTGALYVRRLSGFLITASAAVALAVALAAPGLAWTLTLGVPGVQRHREWLVAVIVVCLVAPQVVLYTIAALGAAAQQARRRYALAAAAPVVENVGLVLTMGAVAVLSTAGEDTTRAGRLALVLGVGASLSVALHAAVQVLGAHRAGLSLRPAWHWRADPEVRAVTRRLRGSVLVAVLPAVGFYLLLAVAATMAGGVILFQTAYLVYSVPTALGARAITTAVLPRMSEATSAGDRQGFAAAWHQGFFYGLITGLPALCVLVAFARPIAGILAAGKLYSPSLVALLAGCIAVLGGAQLAGGIHEIGRQALFARLDVRGPRLASWIAFVAAASCGCVALLLPAGAPRLLGLASAVLLSDLAGAVTVLVLLRMRAGLRVLGLRGLGVALLAAGAMVPALWGGRLLADGGRVHDLLVMVPAVAVAALLFAGVLRALWHRSGVTA